MNNIKIEVNMATIWLRFWLQNGYISWLQTRGDMATFWRPTLWKPYSIKVSESWRPL